MIIVERARLDDLELIMEVEESGFDPRDQWSERAWLSELVGHDRKVFVCRAGDGGVLGVITVQVVGDTADLHRVVVASGARRQGLAQALINSGEDAARRAGASRMIIEVAADNVAAQTLYRHLGYTDLNRRGGYYGAGRDALVLSRELRGGGGEER